MSLQDTIDVVMRSGLAEGDKAKITTLLRLISKSSAKMNGHELRLAREAAGLTVRQAAKLVQLKPQELCDFEDGDWEGDRPGSPLVVDFDRIYELGVE